MNESFEKASGNLEDNLGACLLDASESLESGDVGLRCQLKMFEFMISVNQELKCSNKERVPRQNDRAPYDVRY